VASSEEGVVSGVLATVTSKLLLELSRPHPRARTRGQSLESAQWASPLGGQVTVESPEHKVRMVTKGNMHYSAAVKRLPRQCLYFIIPEAKACLLATQVGPAW